MNTLIPPPAVAAIIGLLMWGVSETWVFVRVVSDYQSWVAFILLAAGVPLMLIAAAQFFAARTTINPLRPANASALITTGAFSLSRNPIYLADLLILGALAAWFGNVLNVALLVLFVCYINRFQIAPEESALREKFGDAYAVYCARVRRWL